jgi:hypothetical protein
MDEAFVSAEASGLIERFSSNGWRTFVRAAGGSSTVDRVRLRDGVEVSVIYCVLPEMDRRKYEADEIEQGWLIGLCEVVSYYSADQVLAQQPRLERASR